MILSLEPVASGTEFVALEKNFEAVVLILYGTGFLADDFRHSQKVRLMPTIIVATVKRQIARVYDHGSVADKYEIVDIVSQFAGKLLEQIR